MDKQYVAVGNGEFILSETDVKNQFLFFREDGGVLGEVGRIPMDLYQDYIAHKMLSGGISGIVMHNICFETSVDGKYIRLTVLGMDDNEETPKLILNDDVKETASRSCEKRQPNFLKRLIKKIFG